MGFSDDRGVTQLLSSDLVRDAPADLNGMHDSLARLIPYSGTQAATLPSGDDAVTVDIDLTGFAFSVAPHCQVNYAENNPARIIVKIATVTTDTLSVILCTADGDPAAVDHDVVIHWYAKVPD